MTTLDPFTTIDLEMEAPGATDAAAVPIAPLEGPPSDATSAEPEGPSTLVTYRPPVVASPATRTTASPVAAPAGAVMSPEEHAVFMAGAPALPPERRLRKISASVGWGIAGFVTLALLWQLGHVTSPTLPGPVETIGELRTLLTTAFVSDGPAGKGIGLQLTESLIRVFKGFAMAAVVGIPLGFLIGTSKRAMQMLNPVVQLLRPVSPLAWFPIWLTIVVKTDAAAVWVIFITALWPVLLNTAAGAASVPRDQLDVSRVFRFSRRTELREIVVPHALPSVITGLRLSMGIAWMVIVAAEMLSAASGIGFFVWQSYNGAGLSHVISAILLIGLIGVSMDTIFLAIGKRLSPEAKR